MSTRQDLFRVAELLQEIGTDDEKNKFQSIVGSLQRRGFVDIGDEAVVLEVLRPTRSGPRRYQG